MYSNSVNWELEFNNKDVNECYTRWLEVYKEGCKRFIPIFKLNI